MEVTDERQGAGNLWDAFDLGKVASVRFALFRLAFIRELALWEAHD